MLTSPPIDGERTSESFFTSSEITLGIDLPIKERFVFTSSVSSGFEFRRTFISLQFSAAIGIRYRFTKNS